MKKENSFLISKLKLRAGMAETNLFPEEETLLKLYKKLRVQKQPKQLATNPVKGSSIGWSHPNPNTSSGRIPKRPKPKRVATTRQVDLLESGEKCVIPNDNVIHDGELNIHESEDVEFELRDLNLEENPTLVIEADIPADSKKYAVNLCPVDHDNANQIFLHFNPRTERGGCLVATYKTDGDWGYAKRVPGIELPQLFSHNAAQLAFRFREEHIDISINSQFFCRFYYSDARPLNGDTLILQIPKSDDYGLPQTWTIRKIWWGNGADLKGSGQKQRWEGSFKELGERSNATTSATQMFISGLPQCQPQQQAQIEAQLAQFLSAVQVRVVPMKSIGFATFANPEALRSALAQFQNANFLGGTLKVSIARNKS